MKNLLQNAKEVMIEKAINLYLDRRYEIEVSEYKKHFQDLGDIISQIDEVKSFSELITDLEKGRFEVLGYFLSDEDMMEEFLKDLAE